MRTRTAATDSPMMQQGMGTWHLRIATSKTTDFPNQAEYADDCFFIPSVITLVGWRLH
jgi:hypothetical protein